MVVPNRALFAQHVARMLSNLSQPDHPDVASGLFQLLELRRTFYKAAANQKVTRPIVYDGQVAEELIREGILDAVLNALSERRSDESSRLQHLLVQVLACLLRYALVEPAVEGNGQPDGEIESTAFSASVPPGADQATHLLTSVGAKRGLFSWYLIKEPCIRTVAGLLVSARDDGEVVRASLKVLLRFAQHNPNRRHFVLDSVRIEFLVDLIRRHGSNVRVVIGAVGIITHALACTQPAEFGHLLIQLDSFHLKQLLDQACSKLAKEPAFPRLEAQLHRLMRLLLRPQQLESLQSVDQRNQRELEDRKSVV